MVRPCLVLAILLSATTAASAEEPNTYACPSRVTYPDWGADNIPTNAHAFEMDIGVPSFKVTSLGDLDPESHYELHDPVYLDFKTGKGPSVHVPLAPQGVTASITVTSRHLLNTVSLDGRFDHDAPFLEVELQSKTNPNQPPLHFGMDSWNRTICCINAGALDPGPVIVTVTAWTPATHSEPFTFETTVTVDDTNLRDQVCPEHHHVRCGMGSLIYIIAIPFLLIVALLIVLVISAFRNSRIRNMPGEHVSVILGESVARVVAKSFLIKSVVGVASTMVLLEFDYTVTAVFAGMFSFLWLIALIRARRLVSRFELPVNRLERREDWLMVDHTLLYCGRRAWNRAASLPRASATIQK